MDLQPRDLYIQTGSIILAVGWLCMSDTFFGRKISVQGQVFFSQSLPMKKEEVQKSLLAENKLLKLIKISVGYFTIL